MRQPVSAITRIRLGDAPGDSPLDVEGVEEACLVALFLRLRDLEPEVVVHVPDEDARVEGGHIRHGYTSLLRTRGSWPGRMVPPRRSSVLKLSKYSTRPTWMAFGRWGIRGFPDSQFSYRGTVSVARRYRPPDVSTTTVWLPGLWPGVGTTEMPGAISAGPSRSVSGVWVM